MATKKKVKAVEPEVVSSVEPEVAAVPMTMAAATPRSNGQSSNGFAKVEQGKSYVLSVNAPSGSGEVELLAADSNTQSEPDMFSLLYTKVENSMQIPFVAVSSWVYVQARSSSINWLVTPANFSLAVPGVSSGGGESFDPEAPQEISGDWQFTGELTRTVKASPAANDVLNKAMGDSVYLQLASPNLQTVAGDVNFQTPVGVGEPVDLNHAVSKGYAENYLMTLDTEQEVQGAKNFEGNIKIRTIQSDITNGDPIKNIIWTLTCANGDMRIYQYNSTSLVGLQSAASGGGFNVAKNGQATCENSLLVRGGTTIKSLSVSGPATFDNTVTVTKGNKILSSVIAQDDLTETTVAPVGSNDARYIQFKSMTKAEYDALETKSNSTIYFLTDQNMWAIGDKKIVTSDMPA